VLHRWRLEARYRLRTIVDALPGPWTRHAMHVAGPRDAGARDAARPPLRARDVTLPAGLLDRLDAAPARTLADGEVLFREGERADRIYFVTDGTIRITKGSGPQAVLVASSTAGDVVGEIGVLHGIPRTATAVASGVARVLSLDGETFRHIVAEEDVSARELAELALRRHAGSILAVLLARAPGRLRRGRLASIDAAPGETIVRRGDAATAFYLLVDGGVDVVVDHASGEALRLARLRAPDCFGEIAMLDHRPRTATVRVTDDGPARLITLDREAFDALVEDADAKRALSLIAARRERPADG
jgi:CRP-like cAMP-binding protein